MVDFNDEKILYSMKAMLGGSVAYDDAFDTDLVVHINSIIATLNQIGIGRKGFMVSHEETWEDFFGSDADATKFMQVKSYMYLKLRNMFDPAQNGAVANALSAELKELEWRIYSEANYDPDSEE